MTESVAKIEHHRIGAWIREGWQLVAEDLASYLAAGLLYAALVFLLGVKTFGLAAFIVLGPLAVGIHQVILEKARSRTTRLSLLLQGFTAEIFPQALVASLVIAIFALLGFALCVIPCLFVLTLYWFTFPLMAEKKLAFWPAMEESRRRVTPHLSTMALFVLALLGINVLGLAACGVGLAFTLPLTMAATVMAHRELAAVEASPETPPSGC